MKKVETLTKNLLLKLLLIFKPDSQKSSNTSSGEYDKLLFIRLNRIGDALVTTPLLHFIKQKLNSKIYVLADVKNFFIFRNNPDIEEVIIFKKGFNGYREFINFVKSKKIQTVVDLHDDVSTTVSFLIALCSSENKYGLEKSSKKIYTKTVKRLNPLSAHIVSRIMEMSRLFNLNPAEAKTHIRYFPKPESKQIADNFISGKFKDGRSVLGINISAGSNARYWGSERYKKLVGSLSGYDIGVLILAAPKDEDKISIIGHPDYFISSNFDEFAAVISKLKILFTPDTAAVHLGSAYNVPVFGIYVHDTADMIWSPINVDFDYVETSESNLKNLEFDFVFNKFKPFLEKYINEKRDTVV